MITIISTQIFAGLFHVERVNYNNNASVSSQTAMLRTCYAGAVTICNRLADTAFERGNKPVAFTLYQRACEQGSQYACNNAKLLAAELFPNRQFSGQQFGAYDLYKRHCSSYEHQKNLQTNVPFRYNNHLPVYGTGR